MVITWWNLNCAENENIPVKNWKEMGSTQDYLDSEVIKEHFQAVEKNDTHTASTSHSLDEIEEEDKIPDRRILLATSKIINITFSQYIH